MRTSAEESDRNLTAFQHGGNIYFRLRRKLAAGERLRVWYSQDYIHRLHAISRESIDQNLEAGELLTGLTPSWFPTKVKLTFQFQI